MKSRISKFCTGCGLCKTVNVELIKNEKGFFVPKKLNALQKKFCKKYCYSQNTINYNTESLFYGTIKDSYLGWSTTPSIRDKGSSGGVLSEIAIYLLENKYVDGIIHVKQSNDNVLLNDTIISYTKEEVLEASGSRYAVTSVLSLINDVIDDSKKYCVIAKPCEISSLRKYINDLKLDNKFPYLLSFFCAGTPSINANKKLLEKLNTNSDICKTLKYRGDGWPGKATAINYDGSTCSIDYDSAWGKILGRDINIICQFCWDGIGELADISCGDGWYLKNGTPDFSESSGRNIIFVRTNKGKMIVNDMIKNNKIYCEEFDHISYFPKIQKYQYYRKANMFYKILALKTTFSVYPKWNRKMMRICCKENSANDNFKMFIGTIKRRIKRRY